ncbi:hypothetical protein M0802_010341 [Mischocyttarus mexicanus]|nr:hypothetical protein M0802_010341 [Mischocyttarus mexicanus]
MLNNNNNNDEEDVSMKLSLIEPCQRLSRVYLEMVHYATLSTSNTLGKLNRPPLVVVVFDPFCCPLYFETRAEQAWHKTHTVISKLNKDNDLSGLKACQKLV